MTPALYSAILISEKAKPLLRDVWVLIGADLCGREYWGFVHPFSPGLKDGERVNINQWSAGARGIYA